MRDTFGEEEFEIIDIPSDNVMQTASNTTQTEKCGNPYCQLSHVSQGEELASDRAIEPLLAIMKGTAKSMTTKGPIFHMSMSYFERDIMVEAFLDGIPLERRKVMNCSNCKRFMRQYGDLCVIADDGALIPLAWPTDLEIVPQYYKKPVENVLELFRGKVVGDEFILRAAKDRILGIPSNAGWNHMSLELPGIPLVCKLSEPFIPLFRHIREF